jgi:prepilin-type N-terminal cleavage/methylation domain-containing protein
LRNLKDLWQRFKSEAGFTLLEIIVTLGIISLATAGVVPQMIHSKNQAEQLAIDSNRELLRTKSSIYYLNRSEHAVKTNGITELMDMDTLAFVEWLCTELGYNSSSNSDLKKIDERFGWISVNKLMDEKLLDSTISDDRYVLDTDTYMVYHITDSDEVREALFAEGGDGSSSLDKMNTRCFRIQTATKYMDLVNSTVVVGNIAYAGGSGTMYLAKIRIDVNTQDVEDISHLLVNPTEVYAVTTVGSGLRVEYRNTSGEIVITQVDY